MIVEPVMMNIGVVPPPPGYLDALAGLLHTHGSLLTFDEVKTGLTIAPGGATERFGVVPDIVCLAKALGGGVPCGAIGGTTAVMEVIADGTYEQVGTFNGNPLTMAAAKAMLLDVLTPAAYRLFGDLREELDDPGTVHAPVLRPAGLRQRLRSQGGDRVLPGADLRLPRLHPLRRPLRPRPLALPAQRRGVPPAVGEDGAVDAVRAAHR